MGGKKQHLRKLLRSWRSVRTWQLFLVLIPLLFLAATLLRFDHLRMADLRAAVIAADAAFADLPADAPTEDVDAAKATFVSALRELQTYTFSHIVINITEDNGVQSIIFGTGPFYLEQQYLRDANAAIAAVENQLASDANPNGNIYEAVRQICQPQALANRWAWSSPGYLNCWTTELAKYPASENLDSTVITAALPSTELYRLSYASPVWAPTPTGFVLLVCAILALIVVVRFLVWAVLKLALIIFDR